MLISLIGAGNLAYHLAQVLEKSGHSIEEIYCRQAEDAQPLLYDLYNATHQDHLDFSQSKAKIFIVAVADRAIEHIAEEIVLPDQAIICHTSGARTMHLLEKTAIEEYGVFYPLQTFTKKHPVDWSEIPVLIEANKFETAQVLLKLAKSFSSKAKMVTEEDRKTIHLAAVFANNFINHLMTITAELLAEKEIPLEIMRPLVAETLFKCFEKNPTFAQTGPARREDFPTIEAHTEMLADKDLQLQLYKAFTQNIIAYYSSWD